MGRRAGRWRKESLVDRRGGAGGGVPHASDVVTVLAEVGPSDNELGFQTLYDLEDGDVGEAAFRVRERMDRLIGDGGVDQGLEGYVGVDVLGVEGSVGCVGTVDLDDSEAGCVGWMNGVSPGVDWDDEPAWIA